MASVMTLTVAMKLQQQFITVTLIHGGQTDQLLVKRKISSKGGHMVIGATVPLFSPKDPATISLAGRVDRDSLTSKGSITLMISLLILKVGASIFPMLSKNGTFVSKDNLLKCAPKKKRKERDKHRLKQRQPSHSNGIQTKLINIL